MFGIIHLLIDATTVTVIFATRTFHGLSVREGVMLVLFYDLIAFAGQAPLGLLIDRFRIWRATALVGIALSAASMLFLTSGPNAAMILAGVGNAAFHVGAGALSLHVHPGRATPPGVFIAPGALGLAAGTMIGKGGAYVAWPFLVALLIAFVVAWLAEAPEVRTDRSESVPTISKSAAIIMLLLFSISLRALLGKAGAIELPRESTVLFGVATAAFAGKAIGGILSDRWGWLEVSVGALLISGLLFAFGDANPVMITFGMFLFQMTTPVTLVATAALLPGRPALAFGLNCLALTAGFLSHFFRVFEDYYLWWGQILMVLLSTTAVFMALRALKGRIPMKFQKI
ncbi:MAG: hypothetical protein IT350_14470 [Deltaproteobacteria bacterium]|nr:hypothetical protein [Deltaproteobacteria bacterium]